jgi:hypothetical protein
MRVARIEIALLSSGCAAVVASISAKLHIPDNALAHSDALEPTTVDLRRVRHEFHPFVICSGVRWCTEAWAAHLRGLKTNDDGNRPNTRPANAEPRTK